jgi:hypothetical protein
LTLLHSRHLNPVQVARKARKVTCTEGPAYNTRSISRRGSAIAYRTRARSIW